MEITRLGVHPIAKTKILKVAGMSHEYGMRVPQDMAPNLVVETREERRKRLSRIRSRRHRRKMKEARCY